MARKRRSCADDRAGGIRRQGQLRSGLVRPGGRGLTMSVDVLTFGCRLNIHESEVIRRDAAGLADTTVVNTCAVTGEAVRQARQAIRKLRRAQPDRRIVVTGCAAQADPQSFAAMPEVDRVVGNEEKLTPQTWANF